MLSTRKKWGYLPHEWGNPTHHDMNVIVHDTNVSGAFYPIGGALPTRSFVQCDNLHLENNSHYCYQMIMRMIIVIGKTLPRGAVPIYSEGAARRKSIFCEKSYKIYLKVQNQTKQGGFYPTGGFYSPTYIICKSLILLW